MGDNGFKGVVGGGCGCYVVILLANLTLGAITSYYSVWELFHKQLPWWGAGLIGLVLGEVTMPLSLVLWILTSVGVNVHI